MRQGFNCCSRIFFAGNHFDFSGHKGVTVLSTWCTNEKRLKNLVGYTCIVKVLKKHQVMKRVCLNGDLPRGRRSLSLLLVIIKYILLAFQSFLQVIDLFATTKIYHSENTDRIIDSLEFKFKFLAFRLIRMKLKYIYIYDGMNNTIFGVVGSRRWSKWSIILNHHCKPWTDDEYNFIEL